MPRTEFISTGFYVPERVVTNDEFTQWMDTSDEWIRTRTGIRERHWASDTQATSDLAVEAAKLALDRAGVKPADVDCIVFATLSPDYMFPGAGVYLQRKLGIGTIPCIDIRNQCTGFIYGLSVADAWIRTGQYRRVLLVGAELQSSGLDLTTRGRDLAVLFGDGAGAALLGPTEDPHRGVLSTHIYADGANAELLWCDLGGSANRPRLSADQLEKGMHWPRMVGREVFKHASTRMPESVMTALKTSGLTIQDVKLVIAHQANQRITEMVQKQLGLRDDQMYANIERYGNTTAASIPIAVDECVQSGRLVRGDLLILTAFGSGFTWGSAAIRW